jgi:4-amino-4-deoxychorismate lyase
MKTEGLILVDGLATGSIQALDRGLHYGDGVFRTMKIVDGEIRWWADHYGKLAADCEALGIACPDESLLNQEAQQVAAQADVGVVKIIITRGVGKRGYGIPEIVEPVRIITGSPASTPVSHDVNVRWCNLRLSTQPRLAGIKHLNRLENVLARSEWSNPEIAEGLLMDEAGRVICGTRSNLFLLERDKLVTPDLGHCGIAGVARQRLMRAAARYGMNVGVEDIPQSRLLAAGEIFLTNSLIEIWRVASLNGTIRDDSGMRSKLVRWLHEED